MDGLALGHRGLTKLSVNWSYKFWANTQSDSLKSRAIRSY